MHQPVLRLLLLAALSAAAVSLNEGDLSSPLHLRSDDWRCPINFGKDRTFGSPHAPEFIYYDGVRCDSRLSKTESTAFVTDKAQALKDVVDAAKGVGDVVTLRANVFETGLRHDRMGEARSRARVVKCGETGLREIMFLEAEEDGVVEARGSRFPVKKGSLYGFVDDVSLSVRGAVSGSKLETVKQRPLCFLKGKFTNDGLPDSQSPPNRRRRVGMIVGGVIVILIVAAVLYGIVYLLYRRSKATEEDSASSLV